MTDDRRLDEVVPAVLTGRKYRAVAPDLVRRLATAELAKGRTPTEAVKAVRSRLHQVAAAYAEQRPDYPAWLRALEDAGGDLAALRTTCRDLMRHHASTRERLPILDRFYAETLREVGPIRRVVDVGCGLNPLAVPWMGLPPDAEYLTYDVFVDLAAFLERALSLLGVRGRGFARDVLDPGQDPLPPADLALALKLLPCLDQLEAGAGGRLFDALGARWTLVSFPVRSLGGREKGMARTYEERFRALLDARGLAAQAFRFESELAFLVRR